MKNKAKLAFEMLEQEIELMNVEQMKKSKGGDFWNDVLFAFYAGSYFTSSYYTGSFPTDCVFQAMSHLSQQTGQNYSVEFLEFLYQQNYGNSSNGCL